MDLLHTEFKRKFSASFYKNMTIQLAEMSFSKDFVNDRRGDLYPILKKSEDCDEAVLHHRYRLTAGSIRRMVCQFFPYATYEMAACIREGGAAGFCFRLPSAEATVLLTGAQAEYTCGTHQAVFSLPPEAQGAEQTLLVSCRPGAFDLFCRVNGRPLRFATVDEEAFSDSNQYKLFTDAIVGLCANGCVEIASIRSYVDNGLSIADIRPIRYEDGQVMTEGGKIYLTATVRLQSRMHQGVFSWIPGTAEFALTGALFYDCGDGAWCGDVAASILYHREKKLWYLWVCAFSHGHVLGHAAFEGDPRFGVNVIDIERMELAPEGASTEEFFGFANDEDPDFVYDKQEDRWLMSICRTDPETKKYRYHFFESKEPFSGYRFLGKGLPGAETGGSFVTVEGERFFLCGNDFHATSDYRIYHKDGMVNAKFNFPDGGFRGWGTLIPVRLGTRTRYFWLTFDRHNASDYNWSYGNLYCFEAP